jgi:hypothetical protein
MNAESGLAADGVTMTERAAKKKSHTVTKGFTPPQGHAIKRASVVKKTVTSFG